MNQVNPKNVAKFLEDISQFLEEIRGSLFKLQEEFGYVLEDVLPSSICLSSINGEGVPKFVMCHCGGWKNINQISLHRQKLDRKDQISSSSCESHSSGLSKAVKKNESNRINSNQTENLEQMMNMIEQQVKEIRERNVKFYTRLVFHTEKLIRLIEESKHYQNDRPQINKTPTSQNCNENNPQITQASDNPDGPANQNSTRIISEKLSKGVQHDTDVMDERYRPTREMLRLLHTKQDKYQHFGHIVMCDDFGNWIFRPAENQKEGYTQRCLKLFSGDVSSAMVGLPLIWPSVLGGWLGQVQLHYDVNQSCVVVKTVVWDIKYNREILKTHQIRYMLFVSIRDFNGDIKHQGEAIFAAKKLTGFVKGELPLPMIINDNANVDPEEIHIRFWIAPMTSGRRSSCASFDTSTIRSTYSRRSSMKSE